MRSLRLQRVKAFQDTGDIQLAPLTIFVGQNSCGKSSFIRFPVVISQSFSSGNSAICLHSNAPGTIDYGNFQDVLYQHQGDSFSFSFTEQYQDLRSTPIIRLPEYNNTCIVRCSITFAKRNSRKASEIIIHDYIVEYDNELAFRFSYNKRKYDVVVKKTIQDGLITETNLEFSFSTKYPIALDGSFFTYRDEDILKGIVNTYFYDNEEIKKSARKIIQKEGYKFRYIGSLNDAGFSDSYNLTQEQYHKIMKAFYAASQAVHVQQALNYHLFLNTNNMHYIGPFRNNPQRIYRRDESVRRKVGHSGEYASDMLINDYIDHGELTKNVSKWFEEAFGYSISVHELKADKTGTGYYQISLKEAKIKKERNLMDVGYGISQVLPIVIQLAEATTKIQKYSRNNNEFFVIEQPELHLHPAAQAKLASLFVNAINNESVEYRRILVETHSEHLIRSIQVMIADPDCFLTNEMVRIYSVEKNEDNCSTITEMKMTEKGQFIDKWPSGFFDKSFELSRALLKAINKRNADGE